LFLLKLFRNFTQLTNTLLNFKLFIIKKLNFLFTIIISCATFNTLSAQDNWTYHHYKSSNDGLLVLEYGISKNGYDGYVKWRLTNKSNKTLLNVVMGDKTYTLQDQKTVKRLGGSISTILAPKLSATEMSDPVNSSENVGSFYPTNNNPVIQIEVKDPIVKFNLSNDGKTYNWNWEEIDSWGKPINK
jgi:hypothetical protein